MNFIPLLLFSFCAWRANITHDMLVNSGFFNCPEKFDRKRSSKHVGLLPSCPVQQFPLIHLLTNRKCQSGNMVRLTGCLTIRFYTLLGNHQSCCNSYKLNGNKGRLLFSSLFSNHPHSTLFWWAALEVLKKQHACLWFQNIVLSM